MEYIVRVVMGSLWGILWGTGGNWWEGILGYVVFHVRIGSPGRCLMWVGLGSAPGFLLFFCLFFCFV